MRLGSRLRCLLLFPLVLVVGLGIFLHSETVHAQGAGAGADRIGTHLIQGDPGAQLQVMNKLTSSGVFPDYPVVVMVYPNGNGTELLGRSGFLTIARVNIDCGTNPAELASLATKIPAGTPVTIGNEINNQNPANGEWKCGGYGLYAQLFNAFASAWGTKGPLGISAMDTINGDYDAANTLQQIFATGINRSAITAVFANVYETGSCGYAPERCSPQAGEWTLSQVNSLAGKSFSAASDLYITEFGTVSCGDYDCIQEFYEKNNDTPAKAIVGFTRPPGQSTGTTWVHTVPYICEYWEGGSLTVQKPTKCGGGKKRPAFVYPGIEDQSGEERMRRIAASYMLTCGNAIQLQGGINNEDALGRVRPPIDCSRDPLDWRCIVPGDGSAAFADVYIDDKQTRIPLIRLEGAQVPNPESPARRTNDLEGFFNSTYTKESTPIENLTLPPLANGVGQKLSSSTQACEQKLQFLTAIKTLCDEEGNRSGIRINERLLPKASGSARPTPTPLPTDGKCALDIDIPGTTYSYLSLLANRPASFSCSATTPTPAPTQAVQAWKKAFAAVETTTPRGFKPAYIIRYIDRPEEYPSNDVEKKVNWLPPGERAGIGNTDLLINDRIKIIKVYVPAGFAERTPAAVPGSTSFFPTYTGGLMQSMLALTTRQEQQTIEINKQKEIDQLAGIMTDQSMLDPNANVTKYLRCSTCRALPQDDYRSVIVRRINAEFFATRYGGYITDPKPGCFDDDLTGERAKEISHTINPSGVRDPIEVAKITATAKLVANRDAGSPLSIRTFFLLPEEYRNLENYEAPFTTMFVPNELKDSPKFQFISKESQRAAGSDGELQSYRFLQLSGSTAQISSPTFPGVTITYPDPDSTPGPVIPGGTPLPPNLREVRLEGQITGTKGVGEIDTNPLVPGGRLARALWHVMCSVTFPREYQAEREVLYPGFEAFLQNPYKACTQGDQSSAPVAGPIDGDYMEEEVARCNTSSGGMTPGNGIPIQDSSYICKTGEGYAASVGKPASLYTPILDIPSWQSGSDGGTGLCTENLYSKVACSYRPARGTPKVSLIAHRVDSSGKFSRTGTMTACEYVVQQAQAKNVSPRLALAMWGEESGFGAYATDKDGQDFGVISQGSSRATGTINGQLQAFLNTVKSNASNGYLGFLRRYSGERTADPNNFCNNKFFPYRLKDFYNNIR